MGINLHDKPFDEGTLKKLEIFELYTKEWLPTFIMSKTECIWIFDFFAGTGYDKNGVAGSPIRILRQLSKQLNNIFHNGTKVFLVFNEFEKSKYAQLKEACENFIGSDKELLKAMGVNLLNYKVLNENFETLFPKCKKNINKYPSLVFLDQNGVKFISNEYFIPLVQSHCTDFLYFVSSSYFKRFGKTKEFIKSISFDYNCLMKEPVALIHRLLIEELKKRIPEGNKTRLYPFSIKKGKNIYGIVFGASHPRAVDKFLATAWKENTINGEANFDIDDDINKGMPDLFGYKALTKIEKFQSNLRQSILDKKLRTNKDVYDYTLEQGHIPSHAVDEIKTMKKAGLISYDKSPKINYYQVYKMKNVFEYVVK